MITLNNNVYNLLKKLNTYSQATYKHSLNVANISVAFAKDLGLNEEDIEKLRIASLLHDIGKLQIPKHILHIPAKLTKEAYAIIKKHPDYGVNLLINAKFFEPEILYLILCHHERIDGLGYPNGIKGEKIPYLAKILTICDSYDAMRTSRIYKEEQNMEYIKKEFEENMGTQFDEYYTKKFLSFIEIHNSIKTK